MRIVFTDLDGTLLDHETYSFAPALPALARLRALGIPVVLVTSKTFAEVVPVRRELSNDDPFIVENGAAVFARPGHPALNSALFRQDGEYEVAEIGTRYEDLVRILSVAAQESRCIVRGFSDMSAAEVSRECGFSLDQAQLAKARDFDEPFHLIEGDLASLRYAVERRGARLARGGRFFHITGLNDKETAVGLLMDAYRREGPIETIGLGDGPHDVGFLHLVDHPILLDSPFADALHKQIPRARRFPAGPRGWNQAILELLQGASQ